MGSHILIVDDELTLSALVQRRLELRGYTVTHCASGASALELLVPEAQVDAALVDVMMPGMTGIEFLRAVRAHHGPEKVPVIMLTARTDAAIVVEALQAGANDHVTKPVDMDVLTARLGAHLDRRRVHEALHRSEERYALAMRGASDGLWDWDAASGQLFLSDRCLELAGVGVPPATVSEAILLVHGQDRERVKAVVGALRRGEIDHFREEVRLRDRGSGVAWRVLTGVPVRDSRGALRRVAGSLADPSGTRLHDDVTGLPNQNLFRELVRSAGARVRRKADLRHSSDALVRFFAVFVVRFERLGHVLEVAGSAALGPILREASQRISACLQGEHLAMDPRSGDGEPTDGPVLTELAAVGIYDLAALCEKIASPADAVRLGLRLAATLEEPINVGDISVRLQPAIGISLGGPDERAPEELVHEASTAARAAGAGADGRCVLANSALGRSARERLRLEADLSRSLSATPPELAVHYQPVVALQERCVVGAEALLRWNHAVRGPVAPDLFIPMAEESGLILRLGEFVLREAFTCAAQWTAGPADRGAWGGRWPGSRFRRMAVNVSPRQIARDELQQVLDDLMVATPLPPGCLELELTEGILVSNPERSQACLSALQQRGIRVALDDFGTGFSALGYLHRFRVDTLKIDRSFVAGLPNHKTSCAITRAILAIAHEFGLEVVAEGVETEAQAEFLANAGCHLAQGWFFAKAVPPTEFPVVCARIDAEMSRAAWTLGASL